MDVESYSTLYFGERFISRYLLELQYQPLIIFFFQCKYSPLGRVFSYFCAALWTVEPCCIVWASANILTGLILNISLWKMLDTKPGLALVLYYRTIMGHVLKCFLIFTSLISRSVKAGSMYHVLMMNFLSHYEQHLGWLRLQEQMKEWPFRLFSCYIYLGAICQKITTLYLTFHFHLNKIYLVMV